MVAKVDKGLNEMFARSDRPKVNESSGGNMPEGSSGELVWSRCSCDGGACVEVATTGDTIFVRNSADPGGVPVTLNREEWRAFLAGVKEGAFDHL
jgi:Domain of unknown function (DUF397)